MGRRGETRNNSEEILVQSFLHEAIVSSSGMGRDIHSLAVSIRHFLSQTTASTTLYGALKDGFGEVVVPCGMAEPCRLLTVARRGSCGPTRKLILLRTQSLVLCSKREIRRGFLRHLVTKVWILFSRVSKQGPCSTAKEDDKGDKTLVQLGLTCEADGVAPPDPV